MTDKVEQRKTEMVDAAESLGISQEEYDKIVDECIFGKEEPVSECLEKAATKYAQDKYMPVQTSQAFKAGANWQKEKGESTTEDLGDYINKLSKQFPEVSFAKLSRIVIMVAKWQREQMLKDAVEGEVLINGMGNPILHLWDKGKHLIDKKVKVILIKED